MNIHTIKNHAITFGVNWTAIKLAFASGVLTGFVTMAIAMAAGQTFLAFLETVR